MKTKVLTVLIMLLVLGVFTSAFTLQPVSTPTHDVTANPCQRILERAAQIDMPSHRAEYQLLDQAAACLLDETSRVIPFTGSRSIDPVYAEFKLQQAERMMGGK